jgi:hypothetical protein
VERHRTGNQLLLLTSELGCFSQVGIDHR